MGISVHLPQPLYTIIEIIITVNAVIITATMVITMVLINMTKTCKANGIESFSRTRGGWMKLVEGYDKSKYGGYRFVGSNFIKVGNFDVDLHNGLYLDCSKPVIDGEKTEIMNLFKIQDGKVTLLNTIPKSTKGWAYKFEDDVNNYFASEDVTAIDVLNVIREMTCNKDIFHEVAMELLKDERGSCWLNEAHFSAYMKGANVYNADFRIDEEVDKMAIDMIHDDHEAYKYFNREIDNDHHYRTLYALIHCDTLMKRFADYDVEYEDISEDHYLNINNLRYLKVFNTNEISLRGATHDYGYWVSFRNSIYSSSETIYILVPNVAKKIWKVQSFELHFW